ncbi:hypothetical protein IAR50_005571 [Cryptococcus sp. DSM 104548]
MSHESIDPINSLGPKRILPHPRYYAQGDSNYTQGDSTNDSDYQEPSGYQGSSVDPPPSSPSRPDTPGSVESIHRDPSEFNPRLGFEYGNSRFNSLPASAKAKVLNMFRSMASAQRRRPSAETPPPPRRPAPAGPSGPSRPPGGSRSFQSYAEDAPEERTTIFDDDNDSLFDIGGDDEHSAEARGERLGGGGTHSGMGYEESRQEAASGRGRTPTFDDFLPKSAFGKEEPPPADTSRSQPTPKPDPYLMSGAIPASNTKESRTDSFNDFDDDPLAEIRRRRGYQRYKDEKEDDDLGSRGRRRSRFGDEDPRRVMKDEEERRGRRLTRSLSRGDSRRLSRASSRTTVLDTTDYRESRQPPASFNDETSRRERLREILGFSRPPTDPPPALSVDPVQSMAPKQPTMTLWERFAETGVETNLFARGEAVARRLIEESQMSQMNDRYPARNGYYKNDGYPSQRSNSFFRPPSHFGPSVNDPYFEPPQSRPFSRSPPDSYFEPPSSKPSFSSFPRPPPDDSYSEPPPSRPSFSSFSRPRPRQSYAPPPQRSFSNQWPDDASDSTMEDDADYLMPSRGSARFNTAPSPSFGRPATSRPSFAAPQKGSTFTGPRVNQEPPSFMRQPPQPGTSIPGYGMRTADDQFISSAMSGGQSYRAMPFGGGSTCYGRY